MEPSEVIKFFRIQLNRCKINLRGARDRRDEKAISNIEHKMAMYQYVIEELSSR